MPHSVPVVPALAGPGHMPHMASAPAGLEQTLCAAQVLEQPELVLGSVCRDGGGPWVPCIPDPAPTLPGLGPLLNTASTPDQLEWAPHVTHVPIRDHMQCSPSLVLYLAWGWEGGAGGAMGPIQPAGPAPCCSSSSQTYPASLLWPVGPDEFDTWNTMEKKVLWVYFELQGPEHRTAHEVGTTALIPLGSPKQADLETMSYMGQQKLCLG